MLDIHNLPVALDQKVRHAKAHIDKSEVLGKQAKDHAISAAILLIELKKEIPHGNFQRTIVAYGIEVRTAQRLMLEFQNPEKGEQRREQDATSKREKRQKRQTSVVNEPAKSDMHGASSHSRRGRENAKSPMHEGIGEPKAPSAEPIEINSIEELKDAVKALPIGEFNAFKQWFREYCGA